MGAPLNLYISVVKHDTGVKFVHPRMVSIAIFSTIRKFHHGGNVTTKLLQ